MTTIEVLNAALRHCSLPIQPEIVIGLISSRVITVYMDRVPMILNQPRSDIKKDLRIHTLCWRAEGQIWVDQELYFPVYD